MKRLLFLAIVAAIGWYGWQHRGVLLKGDTDSVAVLVNDGTRDMLRVRLTVDGQTYVRDVIAQGTQTTFPMPVRRVSDFRLHWEWRGLEGAPDWRGGEVTPGPPRSRCTLTVFDDNGVTVACSPIPTGPQGSQGPQAP